MGNCSSCHIRYQALEVLDTQEMQLFEKGCTEVFFEAGDKIVAEGHPVTHVIYLKKGVLKVCLRNQQGRTTILKLLPAGSFVGLHDVFTGHHHQCSAIALTCVSTCMIDREVFLNLVRSNGAFSEGLLRYISEEEVEYLFRFINLLEKQVPGRVAEILLYFSEKIFHSHTFPLPVTRTELGRMIGASRESVSRIMQEMQREKIVLWKRQMMAILDTKKLSNIARTG